MNEFEDLYGILLDIAKNVRIIAEELKKAPEKPLSEDLQHVGYNEEQMGYNK